MWSGKWMGCVLRVILAGSLGGWTMGIDKILHKIPFDLGDKCLIPKNLTSLCWIHQNQTVCLRKTILNIYNSKKCEIITMTG
jgi:hypothetical protein